MKEKGAPERRIACSCATLSILSGGGSNFSDFDCFGCSLVSHYTPICFLLPNILNRHPKA